jgi:hypothetical protein
VDDRQVSDRGVRRQRRREAVRVKLQRSAEPWLEPGEIVRLWVLGMTAPIPTNAGQGLVNLWRLAVGRARPRGVLMTDRALYLARTGWFRSQVREVLARHPLAPGAPRVEFERVNAIRGSISVDGTPVYVPSVQLESAEAIARGVRGVR